MSRAMRRWTRALPWVLAACLVAGIAMAVYVQAREAPVYRAVYTLYAQPAGEDTHSGAELAGDCDRLTQTQAFRQEVLSRTPSDGHCYVDVRAVAGTHMMEVVVTGPDAAIVSGLANAVGEALLQKVERLFDVQIAREMERARTPQSPDQGGRTRRIIRSVLLTFLAGSLLGLCVPGERSPLSYGAPQADAFALGGVGNLRRAQRRYLKKTPVPQDHGTFLDFAGRWIREDIRKVVLSLRASQRPARSLVLAAVGAGEADGAFAVLLSQELSRQGFRVLLMETQACSPGLRDLLDVRARADLLDYHDGRAQWGETVVPTSFPTLSFVDWLHPGHSVADVAATEWFEAFLRSAEAHFDFVLMHAAPVDSAADAATLSLAAGGVVLVARDRAYALEDLEAAAASIARLGKPVKGVVFTQVHADT